MIALFVGRLLLSGKGDYNNMNVLEHSPTRLDDVLKNREIVSVDSYATIRRKKTGCSGLTLTLKPLNENEKPTYLTIIPSREYGLNFFVKSEK